MPDICSEPQLATWQVPECPFVIEYVSPVLEEIRMAVADAFFAVPHGGAELDGVLFGTRTEQAIRILAARPLACEHAFGPSFTLSDNDHARMSALLESVRTNPALSEMVPLGWYHSHTRSEILLSNGDLALHDRYFPEPWQVALVIRPHAIEPARAGFFFRGGDGKIRAEESYREFIVEPELSRLAIQNWRGESQPSRRQTATVSAFTPEAPRFLMEQPRSSRRWRDWSWALLLAGVGIACAGFIARDQWFDRSPAASEPPAAPLIATEQNGQIQIRWDPASQAVIRARSGTLEIADGGAHAVILLPAAQLHGGSLTYVRQTARVDVRLVLEEPGGQRLEQVATFFGQTPPVEQNPEWLRLRDERDRLARENAALRFRYRQLEDQVRKEQAPQ